MRQAIFALIIICGLLFVGCSKSSKTTTARTGPPKSDVDFAREVFRLLAEGDESAAEMIDWEHLSMAGLDVGANYRSLSGDAARANFQKSFIKGYSNSFKASGGTPDAGSNWREQSKDSTQTVVAADGPTGKVLLMTIVHPDGQQKLSVLDTR